MITATYFMVAGGPYGLEDIVQKTGYIATLLILASILMMLTLEYLRRRNQRMRGMTVS